MKTITDDVRLAVDEGLPFSLCCILCDAGMDVESPGQAIREGWRDLQVSEDLPSCNFLGACPVCAPDWLGVG